MCGRQHERWGVPCTPHTPKQTNGRPHINGCIRCEAAKTGASKHGPEHMAAIGFAP